MARETKQDRVVRSMFDSVAEHVHQLKAIAVNPGSKELDVERWCESVFRSCLGYSAVNGYNIRAQEVRGRMRPDLILYKGDQAVAVIEVKKLGYDLDKSDFRSGKVQLAEYLHAFPAVRWGILSNGYEWKLFDFSQAAFGAIEVHSFDIRNDEEVLDTTKRSIEDDCWEFLDLHESTFSSGAWEEIAKEATAFSPESLARAIFSADVVKQVAKIIRGEHEFKANIEVLFDKVSDLLFRGLDDCVSGWNETKQAELQKFIKSEKRSVRRKKRSRVAVADTPGSETTEVVTAEAVQASETKKVA